MLKELRKDPITRRWVIISKERAKRPHEFEKTVETPINFCPFDYGNESLTPPEVLSFRNEGTKANESGWWVRVVPNKFPALDNKIDFEKNESDYNVLLKIGKKKNYILKGGDIDENRTVTQIISDWQKGKIK